MYVKLATHLLKILLAMLGNKLDEQSSAELAAYEARRRETEQRAATAASVLRNFEDEIARAAAKREILAGQLTEVKAANNHLSAQIERAREERDEKIAHIRSLDDAAVLREPLL